MTEKPIDWRGSALRDIKNDDIFSPNAKSAHITPAKGNVFADLGFDATEAAQLKAESQRVISKKLAIKAELMAELAQWIETKELKQSEAAEILGVTRQRVSDLVNQKFIRFTIDALVDMLARTGKQVHLPVY